MLHLEKRKIVKIIASNTPIFEFLNIKWIPQTLQMQNFSSIFSFHFKCISNN